MKEARPPRPSTLWLIAFTAAFLVVAVVALISLLLAVMWAPRVAERALQGWRPLYRLDAFAARITARRQRHITLVCTVGAGVVAPREAYPPDGVCHYTVFTHVSYDQRHGAFRALGASSTSQAAASWRIFLREASGSTVTRLLPSHGDWEAFVRSLAPDLARRINASLVRHRLHGLALFHVRVRPAQLSVVAAAMQLLAKHNPGMFLALGVSFEGVNDANALSTFPPGLLDDAVAPLSLLVLETHVPPRDSGGRCRAVLSSVPDSYVGDSEPQVPSRLSLRGAIRILDQHPDLRRVAGTPGLAGCFSLFLGALVFNTSSPETKLGAVCSSWSADQVSKVCEHPSVRLDEHTQVAYGRDGKRFFSFESVHAIVPKLTPLLNATLLSDRTPCLALYNIELDDGVCLRCPSERYPNIVVEVNKLLSLLNPDSRCTWSLWKRLFPSSP
ncbi:uncharacterized protein [Dermacentor albipictus]|uniref:uncharacterized protein n=1 Tax=Dermacentor albipictus TaxID=60249 RepID=UPI0031FD2171